MPSKHIRSRNPSISGAGGGSVTVTAPSARWSEDGTADEAIGSLFVTHRDTVAVDDVLASMFFVNPEPANVDDVLTVPLAKTIYSEDATANDLIQAQFISVDVGRTLTPDIDPMFDAYGDQALGALNFGNANLLIKKNAVASTNEKRAWLTIDLTNYGAWTAGGSGFGLTFRASTTLLALTQNLTWTATWTAAKPFTESTVTFSAPPTAGTAMTSGTVPVSATPNNFSIGLTAGTLQPALGNWLTFTFTVADAADLGVDTITVISRDQVLNRPTYSITYLQRGT